MKPHVLIGAVSAVVVAVCGIGWAVLPSLEASQRAVNAEASMHVERARRLLHKYNLDMTRTSLLLEQLLEAGVDVDVEDADALVDAAVDDYQTEHEEAWEAYQPTDWQREPRKRRANYGDIARQVREGIRARADLVAENERWIQGALDAVEQALSLTRGDANSRSYAEANRLKGTILFHLGLAEWIAADARRREADPFRRDLIERATQVAALHATQTLVADSGIDARIADLQAAQTAAEAVVGRRREALASLDRTVQDLEARLSAAQNRADEARAAMDKLKADGVDFSDPDGADAFARAFSEQDRIYREALREVQSLEAGALPHAHIDRSGDYLSGTYIENGSKTDLTIEHGLAYYRNERSVLAAAIEVEEQAIEDLRSDIARLDGMKSSFRNEQDRAARQVPDAIATAAENYDELNRIESEAFAIEEKTLRVLEQSARFSKQAANDASNALTTARDRTRNLSPDAKQRSAFAKREQDRWISGHIAAQIADARLVRAWIYHQRYNAYTKNADLLAHVAGPLDLKEASAEAERIKANEAHDAGVEEITLAIAELQKTHRDVGRHWTVVAQEAGMTHLLALFGHPSYLEDAIEAYRSAVKGREDKDHARPFVTQLNRLESR